MNATSLILMLLLVGVAGDACSQGTRNIVALGDSLTAGISSDTNAVPYPRICQATLGDQYEVVNKGTGGHTTLNLLSRFSNEVLHLTFRDERKADVLLLLAGVNDIAYWIDSKGVTNSLYEPCAIISRLRSLARQSNDARMTPVVMTFWPDSDFTDGQRKGIAEVNAWIVTNLTNEVTGSQAFDLAEAITGQTGSLAGNILAEYDDGGGLHLNKAGYERIAEEICRRIAELRGTQNH